MSDVAGLISHSPLFERIVSSVLHQLAESAREHRCVPKGMMLDGDDLASRFYVVLEGRMKMVRPSVTGAESLEQMLFPGEVCCPVALVRGGCCSSYVEALCPCRLLSWRRDEFLEVLRMDRQLHLNLMTLLASHVELERRKRCLTQCRNVPVRVANYLMALLEHQPACCLSHCCLDLRPLTLTAQELGMARETLSRTFSRFQKDGILHCDRGVIRIDDGLRLQRIAEGCDAD